MSNDNSSKKLQIVMDLLNAEIISQKDAQQIILSPKDYETLRKLGEFDYKTEKELHDEGFSVKFDEHTKS